MKVQRIHHDGGSLIVPPLNPDWCDLHKLQWRAAVIEHDNLMPEGTIQIREYRGGFVSFAIDADWARRGAIVGTFSRAWDWLSGIELGVQIKEAQ